MCFGYGAGADLETEVVLKSSHLFLGSVAILTAFSLYYAETAWPAPQRPAADRSAAPAITLQKYTSQQIAACKPLGAGGVSFPAGSGTTGTIKDISNGVVKDLSGRVASADAPLFLYSRFPEREVFPGDMVFGLTGSLGKPEIDAAGKERPTMFLVFISRADDGNVTEIGREAVFGAPNDTDIQGGVNKGTYLRVNEMRLEIVTPGTVNLSSVYGIIAKKFEPGETDTFQMSDNVKPVEIPKAPAVPPTVPTVIAEEGKDRTEPAVPGNEPAKKSVPQTMPHVEAKSDAHDAVYVPSPEITVQKPVEMPAVKESAGPQLPAASPAAASSVTGIVLEDYTGKTFDPQGAGGVFFQMGSGTSGSLEEVSAGVQSVSGYVRSADAPLTVYSKIDERTIRPGDVRFAVQGKMGAPDIDPVTGSPKPSMCLLFVHRYPEGDPRDPIVIGSEPIFGTANPAVLKGGVNTHAHAQVNEVHLQIVVPGLVELSQVQGIMRIIEKPAQAAVAAIEETSLVKPIKLTEYAGETFSTGGAGNVWFDNVTGTNGSVSKNAEGGISVSGHIAAPNAPLVVYRLTDAVLDVVYPGEIVIGFKGEIISADPHNPAKPKPAMYITFYSAPNGVYTLLGRERILGDIVPDTLKVAVNNGTYTKVKKVQLEIADAAGEVNLSNVVGLISEIKAAAPINNPDADDQRVQQ